MPFAGTKKKVLTGDKMFTWFWQIIRAVFSARGKRHANETMATWSREEVDEEGSEVSCSNIHLLLPAPLYYPFCSFIFLIIFSYLLSNSDFYHVISKNSASYNLFGFKFIRFAYHKDLPIIDHPRPTRLKSMCQTISISL